MNSTLTRRSAVAALAGLSAAAVLPPAAIAQTTGSTRWIAALALYRARDTALSAANDALDEAQMIYFRRAPKRPTFVMEMEGDYGRLGKHILPLTITHDELDDPTQTWREPDKVEQFRRTLADYRSADAALRLELGLSNLEDAQSKAVRQQMEALAALLGLPAPDMAALAQKLEIILAEYDDEGDGVAAVLADVRRLSGREG